jgi:aromatic-L-amino-acid/L-tryptophan decarboxylase
MSPDQFRALGHRLIDWIADYHATHESRPVAQEIRPGALLSQLDEHPPEDPADDTEWDRILTDLSELIVPGLMHWQSPNFFGYFPCNHSGPGILAELVSAGLDVNGMLWATSPAATELEMRTLDWMAELIGLPDRFRFGQAGADAAGGGCIQNTASDSTLVSLLAARTRAVGAGIDPAKLRLYASQHAHSSITKAAMIAGLAQGPEDTTHLRRIPGVCTGGEHAAGQVHDQGGVAPSRPSSNSIQCGVASSRPQTSLHHIDTSALASAIDEDQRNGLHPLWVCATIGTTGSEAIDSLTDIAAVIPDDTWLHIDAAYTGATLVCPEYRWMINGIERVDSICFNPHKWLLTNFDCDLFWVADADALTRALSIMPEYLRNKATDAGTVVDYRDWQVPLGRRFRALKLWFVMRHYGRSGLQAHIREHIRLAAWFEAQVEASDELVLAAPRVTGLICFRHKDGEAASRELFKRINASGEVFISHTTLPDSDGGQCFTLRVSIGSTLTQERHVHALWERISRA